MLCSSAMQLPCTKCKRFNDQKIGFVSDPYDCTKYYTCFRKNNGENSELSHMDCPTGTMFNSEHAQDGVPCVDADESCENPMNPEDDDEGKHPTPNCTLVHIPLTELSYRGYYQHLSDNHRCQYFVHLDTVDLVIFRCLNFHFHFL